MHRTQIYFEEALFDELKRQANALGISLSAYIRDVLKKDLHNKKHKPTKLDFSNFSGMWKDREIDQASLRGKAWRQYSLTQIPSLLLLHSRLNVNSLPTNTKDFKYIENIALL